MHSPGAHYDWHKISSPLLQWPVGVSEWPGQVPIGAYISWIDLTNLGHPPPPPPPGFWRFPYLLIFLLLTNTLDGLQTPVSLPCVVIHSKSGQANEYCEKAVADCPNAKNLGQCMGRNTG